MTLAAINSLETSRHKWAAPVARWISVYFVLFIPFGAALAGVTDVAIGELQRGDNKAAALATLKRNGIAEMEELIQAHIKYPSIRDDLFEVFTFLAQEQTDHPKIPQLVPVFAEYVGHDRTSRRMAAANALGDLGAASHEAVDTLREVLSDSSDSMTIEVALRALQNIAADLRQSPDKISAVALDRAAISFRQCVADSNRLRDQLPAEHSRQLKPRIDEFQSEAALLLEDVGQLQDTYSHLLRRISGQYPNLLRTFALVIAATLVPPSIWCCLLAVHPGSLITVRGWLGTLISRVTGLNWFAGRHRVLDAWVKSRIEKQASKAFNELKERLGQRYRICVPVSRQRAVRVLENKDLQDIFERPSIRMVIRGHGGSGKTNLAFEIARMAIEKRTAQRLWRTHQAIPAVVTAMDANVAAEKRLRHAIKQHLYELAKGETCRYDWLLDRLLASRRVIVIIDGFSEMGPVAADAVRANIDGLPAALVVTSRHSALDSFPSLEYLESRDLSGDDLTHFVASYIEKEGNSKLFESKDIIRREVMQLTNMKTDERVTVLMAKMYADLMVTRRDTRQLSSCLPATLPDLMYAYLSWLNRGESTQDPNVYVAAKLLAWKCLELSFRPGLLRVAEAAEVLKEHGLSIEYLDHLIHRVQLVHLTIDRANLRFTHEPLAEYLSAMYLVEMLGSNAERWDRLLARLSKVQDDGHDVTGFATALLQCCDSQGAHTFVPSHVASWLRSRIKAGDSYSAVPT